MKLRWPDENGERAAQTERERDSFLNSCRNLSGFFDAASRLENSEIEKRSDTEAIAECLETTHPHIAARIRSEEQEFWLRTADALFAEASLRSAAKLNDRDAAVKLGRASGTLISNAWIADALREKALRDRIVKGLEQAFQGVPTFIGEGKQVDQARNALAQARAAWGNPSDRTMRDLRMSLQWAPMMLLVEPIHALMRPLFDASADDVLQLLDTMPSPADIVLVLDLVRLGTTRFETWAHAIKRAPAAWDERGWVGCQQQRSSGLILPLLLWQAESHLLGMAEDAEGVSSPEEVANVVRSREDGAMTAWRWTPSLLKRADRDDRDGRARPSDGIWRTAQALASPGGWDAFDAGYGDDALLLEAAQRLVPGSLVSAAPPRLVQLLPTTPEAFFDDPMIGHLCWGAVGLVGGLGPVFDGRTPYGTAVRILATGLIGKDGADRLRELWSDALVLRELSAGRVVLDLPDHRSPDVLLHLIIALGLAAVEMMQSGSEGDPDVLLSCLAVMLKEIEPWDFLGHETLNQQFVKLSD